jgi:hypothetical protein
MDRENIAAREKKKHFDNKPAQNYFYKAKKEIAAMATLAISNTMRNRNLQ